MAVSDWIEHGIEIGDRVRLAAEGIYGVVTNIMLDDDGDPASCILRLSDGSGLACVDLSRCAPVAAGEERLN